MFTKVIAVLGFPVCRDIMVLCGFCEKALLLRAFGEQHFFVPVHGWLSKPLLLFQFTLWKGTHSEGAQT